MPKTTAATAVSDFTPTALAPAAQPTSWQLQHHELRNVLRSVKQRLGNRVVLPLSLCLGPRIDKACGILMYHRISPHYQRATAPTWNVNPQRFREQITGLLDQGFEAWPLRKILAHHQRNEAIPRNVFAITFDDGYENNYRFAFPILQKLQVPATIFLATAYLDSPSAFPSDDWAAAGSLTVPTTSWRPLTTEQCREMQSSGLIELAAHTHTHADFRNRPDALQQDLEQCLSVLHEKFGLTDATFAFPYGTKSTGFAGPTLAAAARAAGMICALTTESDLVTPESNPFDWGRFTAYEFDTAATLAAKLNGWYSLLNDSWKTLKGQGAQRDKLVNQS